MSVRVPFLRPRHFFWAPSKKAQPVRRLYSRTDELHRRVWAAKKGGAQVANLEINSRTGRFAPPTQKKMGQKPVIDIAFEASSN